MESDISNKLGYIEVTSTLSQQPNERFANCAKINIKESSKVIGGSSEEHGKVESNSSLTLKSANQNSDPTVLFRKKIDRCQLHKQLARISLSLLFTIVPALHNLARSKLQSAFYKWNAVTTQTCLGHVSNILKENEMINSNLEQRSVVYAPVLLQGILFLIYCCRLHGVLG